MANNAVWQVLHLLCILAHISMFAAGIATFVVNEFGGRNSDDFADVIYPWAVCGIVSYSPKN